MVKKVKKAVRKTIDVMALNKVEGADGYDVCFVKCGNKKVKGYEMIDINSYPQKYERK